MAMHDGHRERLRGRFLKEGLDHFEEINVLELLLFYCIPRVDTNPIAHRLLETFGSFPNVLEASVEDLMKVEGVGKNAAVFLSMINSTNRYYLTKKAESGDAFTNREAYINELKPKFVGRKNEVVYMLCLDPQGKKISCNIIAEGTACSSSISVRKVVEVALSNNAVSIILAHNHPNGSPLPSKEDKDTSAAIQNALNPLGVTLIDHIVFGRDDYFSMIDINYISEF